ncbi:hypothetical protein MUK42_31797, partial [Musa troglodytarum]
AQTPSCRVSIGSSVFSGAANHHWELSLGGAHLIIQPQSNGRRRTLPNGHQPLMGSSCQANRPNTSLACLRGSDRGWTLCPSFFSCVADCFLEVNILSLRYFMCDISALRMTLFA